MDQVKERSWIPQVAQPCSKQIYRQLPSLLGLQKHNLSAYDAPPFIHRYCADHFLS
jgi:hypothetical protein